MAFWSRSLRIIPDLGHNVVLPVHHLLELHAIHHLVTHGHFQETMKMRDTKYKMATTCQVLH